MTYTMQQRWGGAIRALREERGLSINRLAQVVGLDTSHLWRAEHGEAGLGDDLRVRLATALGVRVEEIFSYPDTATGDGDAPCPSSAANAAAEAPSRPSATTPTTPRARTRPGGRHPARSARAAEPSADEDGPPGTEGGAA